MKRCAAKGCEAEAWRSGSIFCHPHSKADQVNGHPLMPPPVRGLGGDLRALGLVEAARAMFASSTVEEASDARR